MSANLITSPKGRLVYLNLSRKQQKSDQDKDSPLGYSARVEFDDTKENQAWKETISKINKAILTEGPNGTFRTKTFSQFLPEVSDGDGNTLDEMPSYYTGSHSSVQIIVAPYEGAKPGHGSINFAGLIVHELEVPEGVTTGGAEGAREATKAAIRAALGKK